MPQEVVQFLRSESNDSFELRINYDNNIAPDKVDFWYFLLTLLLFVVWIIFLAYYFQRCLGPLVGFLFTKLLRFMGYTGTIKIGSISASFIAGKVLVAGLIVKLFMDLKNNYFGWYDQVRIQQLVQADDDAHLWIEASKAAIEDISFDIQTSKRKGMGLKRDALQIHFLGELMATNDGTVTVNPEAASSKETTVRMHIDIQENSPKKGNSSKPQATTSTSTMESKKDPRIFECELWQCDPKMRFIDRFRWDPPLIDEVLKKLQPVPYLSRLEGVQLLPGPSLIIRRIICASSTSPGHEQFLVNLSSGPRVEKERRAVSSMIGKKFSSFSR
ncbi:unnamed protein product, partial [Mesorhabditis spiculigera]